MGALRGYSPEHRLRRMAIELKTALRLTPALLLMGITLSACGEAGSETGDASEATPFQAADLAGRSFVTTSVQGHQLVADTQVRLTFEESRLTAQAGCNTLFGEYAVTKDLLYVTNMGGTEMGCVPELLDQDEWLMTFLGGRPNLVLDGDRLILSDGGAEVELTDTKVAEPDVALEGTTWVLDTHYTDEATSHLAGMENASITLTDGRAAVAGGCNRGSASYELDGDQLVIGPMALTRKMCDDQAMQVENLMTRVLDGEPLTVAIDSSQLRLMRSDGTGIGLHAAPPAGR